MATKMIRLMMLLILVTQACLVGNDGVARSSSDLPARDQSVVRVQLEQRAARLRKEIDQAAGEFESYLNTVELTEEATAFITQLEWPHFKSELEKQSPDIFLLRSYSKRLYEPFSTVDLDKTVQLRDALDQYTAITRVLRQPDIEGEIQRRQRAVETLLASDGRLDSIGLGQQLEWLELVGRPVELPAVLQQHDQPNIALDIPKSVVTDQIKNFDQEVTQSQYVSNVVAGTPISGFAYTTGTATAQLLPDEGSAAGFRINLQGIINAPNQVAVQDPVRVYTSGQTHFSANKSVHWDGNKLSWGPTRVQCQTQSSITGIEVTRQPILPVRRRPGPLNRVIERAAWRRAEQQRPQGEAAASRLAESTVAESFNAQVSELVGKLNEQLDQYVTRPLRQTGMMPAIDALNSADTINVLLTREGPGGLAGTARPDWKVDPQEFALHLHESALTSFMRPACGGAVWSDRKFAELQRLLIGTNSYELRIGLHRRWQVTLDWNRPLSSRFEKDQITLQINAESLTIEGDEFRYPFTVEATYIPDARGPAIGFVRVGDLRFKWAGQGPTSPGEADQLANFIHRKFDGFLLDQIYLDGLKVPEGGGFWGVLGSYGISRADSDNGWLLIAFRHD